MIARSPVSASLQKTICSCEELASGPPAASAGLASAWSVGCSLMVTTAATPVSRPVALLAPGAPRQISSPTHEAAAAGQIPRERACRRTAEDCPGATYAADSQGEQRPVSLPKGVSQRHALG